MQSTEVIELNELSHACLLELLLKFCMSYDDGDDPQWEKLLKILNYLKNNNLEHVILQPDSKDNTALSLASQYGYLDTVKLLLEIIPEAKRPAAIMYANNEGNNALRCASFDTEIVRILFDALPVEHRLAAVNHENNKGNTALMHASCNGSLNTIGVLLRALPRKHLYTAISYANIRGRTPLMIACYSGRRETVRALLIGYEKLEKIVVKNNPNIDDASPSAHKSSTKPHATQTDLQNHTILNKGSCSNLSENTKSLGKRKHSSNS